MFLKKLQLQNFKCLSDIELAFEGQTSEIRRQTFVLGDNGTGKSNILMSIALVTSGSNALGELLGNANNWIKYNETTCKITAVLETRDGEKTISLQINRDDDLRKIILNNLSSLQLFDESPQIAERQFFVVAYGANRRLSKEGSKDNESSNNRFNNVKTLFDSSTNLYPLTKWIINLDYRSASLGRDIIRAALNDLLPGIKFHDIVREKEQVLFETSDGITPLEQLSDGYQNMAAWIGDLLYRITETFSERSDPLRARGLLLIDEVDLHLHPKAQRKLYNFIRNKLPNFQVVATTHSPITAQQAGEDELYALRRNEENEIQIIPFKGSPKSLLVNQLLMTPVFGLETDESYEIEVAKNEYSELKLKGDHLSPEEKKRLTAVREKLKQRLPRSASPKYSAKEIALLERIEKTLKNK